MRKSLIIGLTVLSFMLCAGSAYSVEGPSQTVVFPFICEVPTKATPSFLLPAHLDMVFTIAEVNHVDTNVFAIVRNYKSDAVLRYNVQLSRWDVARETCLGVISRMSLSAKNSMIETIGGKQYYVGFIEYDVADSASQAIIGWGEMQTLRTLILGAGQKSEVNEWLYTDAGFNGVPDFYVNVNAATTINGSFPNGGQSWNIESNQTLMPRFRIANDDPDTHNWWIIMTPSDVSNTSNSTCERYMSAVVCDEEELCISGSIPLLYQVNIVNVADFLSLIQFPTTFPKAGFAQLEVVLVGTSASSENPCGNAGNEQYVGWSYQYTQGDFNLKTALIFPMHRKVSQ